MCHIKELSWHRLNAPACKDEHPAYRKDRKYKAGNDKCVKERDRGGLDDREHKRDGGDNQLPPRVDPERWTRRKSDGKDGYEHLGIHRDARTDAFNVRLAGQNAVWTKIGHREAPRCVDLER